MNLALLVYELRALGVKSLALELSDPCETSPPAFGEERPTLAPEATSDEPQKDPALCVEIGCGEKATGIFGGKAGSSFCRAHAFAKAGVRA